MRLNLQGTNKGLQVYSHLVSRLIPSEFQGSYNVVPRPGTCHLGMSLVCLSPEGDRLLNLNSTAFSISGTVAANKHRESLIYPQSVRSPKRLQTRLYMALARAKKRLFQPRTCIILTSIPFFDPKSQFRTQHSDSISSSHLLLQTSYALTLLSNG